MTVSKSEQILDVYSEYHMLNFGTPKVVLDHGADSKVWDVDGKEYIDLLGGLAVNTLGHANSELVQTIHEQAQKLIHVSNFFTTSAQTKLAQKLVQILQSTDTGVKTARVMLTNSGTESVEGALKIAKKHAQVRGKSEGKIIVLQHSFHGRTLGSLSLTSKEKYRTPFNPLIPNVEFVKPNDISALKKAFNADVIAMIVEPIQGEAGVFALESDYLQSVRKLTTRNNALMIVDEVQTGVGRTGNWFAYKMICENITPDVITLAKGIGGGFPIGAIIAINDASNVLQIGDHGTTFGGNPLASATALTVLDMIKRDDLLANARKCYQVVSDVFKTCEFVSHVRGSGALIALQLTSTKSTQVYEASLQHGVIVNPVNESSLRLAPALNIESEVLEDGCNRLKCAIEEVFAGNSQEFAQG